MIPFQETYLVATLPLLALYGIFHIARPDLRRPMLVMGLLVGFVSVASAYFWWTTDWWRPLTITGTKVGIEDFLSGFGAGGIMATAYEVLFHKRMYRARQKPGTPSGATILLLLAFVTAFAIGALHLTTFWASTVALMTTACVIYIFRRDMIADGLLSGALMLLASLPSYALIVALSPGWIDAVYQFHTLSGIRVFGVPVEEFIFWFLAGTVWGPLYAYTHGERFRSMK